MNLLSALTQEQLAAVQAPPGVNLVLAIPGSGKTAVFVHRIAHLVKEAGVKPENILGLTFARKAAHEIAVRLNELIPTQANRVSVHTFHALGYRIIKEAMDFNLADDDSKIRIIKKIVSAKALKPDMDIGEIIRSISLAKNNLIDVERFREECKSDDERKLAVVWELYEAGLKDEGKIDLDDLILKTHKLLIDRPDILSNYQGRFHHVLCDESQDNCKVQAEILSLLAKPQDNLFLCGDDDQAIHNFRGASAEYILNLGDAYPAVNRFLLGNNFRSTGSIIRAADNLIRNNTVRYFKELNTDNEYGSEIQIIRAANDEEEARIIAEEIACLVKGGEAAYCDIAILYRMNSMSLPFEDLFPVKGIPYELVGGNEFYSRREICSIINYLRVIFDPNDDEAMLNILDIPVRYLGGRARADIQAFSIEHGTSCYEAMKNMRFSRMYQGRNVKELLRELDYIREMPQALSAGDLISEVRALFKLDDYFRSDEISAEDNSRIQNIEVLQKRASEFNKLEDFLKHVRGRQNTHAGNEGVKFLSIHGSKGLEFPVVFLVGVNEGILPHQKSVAEKSIEEERRLCYMAMTRAKERIICRIAYSRITSPSSLHDF